ncbi:MAG: alpha/beta fold hydrolase [Pseudomonadota bacterium]
MAEIPVRLMTSDGHRFAATIFTPDAKGTYPAVLFSHGNFASPDRYRHMLNPIAAAGYVLIAPTHLDAEILRLDPKPPPETVWATRNAEIALIASIPEPVRQALDQRGTAISEDKLAVMGHSYGALIAQLAAGALAIEQDGTRPDRKIPHADALVAWSPPGPIANMIDAEGWSHIDLPSLTITGTADILPGFIDDWELHKVSYGATPPGQRWLWVGEDVNHYFDGMFGRPGSIRQQIGHRFNHAIVTTVRFLDKHLKPGKPLTPVTPTTGVTLVKD